MRLRVWALAALLAAGAIGAGLAQDAKPAQEPKPAQIDRNGVLILIRSSLLALDQANKTGNYTVLRDLGAPGFQATNTAARLGEIFASLRRDKIDLSGVAVLDPQLTLLPQIESNGMMHMSGFFPSVPAQVKFELRLCAGGGAVEAVRHVGRARPERPRRAAARARADRRRAARPPRRRRAGQEARQAQGMTRDLRAPLPAAVPSSLSTAFDRAEAALFR